MNINAALAALTALLVWPPAMVAFSPYEAYLMSGKQTHVGLIATIRPEKKAIFHQAFKNCHKEPISRQLQKAGISNVQAFTRNIEGADYAVVYFTFAGGRSYLGGAAVFEEATRAIDWAATTSAHPRAKRYGRHWLQMEWINFIRGVDLDRASTSTLMIATTVIPEKEAQYRTLHQTVWPGVVDQAIRGNIRNLNIYLVELGDQLVEFLYLESIGDDPDADDLANKADPVNQRWWKQTDECQRPFSDQAEGIWSTMNPVE